MTRAFLISLERTVHATPLKHIELVMSGHVGEVFAMPFLCFFCPLVWTWLDGFVSSPQVVGTCMVRTVPKHVGVLTLLFGRQSLFSSSNAAVGDSIVDMSVHF